MPEPKVLSSLDDLQFDEANANVGTGRGLELLRESIEQCGVGRSIVVDKYGVVIGGNKTLQVAKEQSIPITVVPTHGHELVVVQRSDLDLLEEPRARQLTYYDNRVAEVNLDWSPQQVLADMTAGIDLSSSFFPEELHRILDKMPVAPDPMDGIDPVVVEAALPEAPVEDADIPAPPVAGSAPEPSPKEPHPVFEIVFENITQQIRWTAFLRALRDRSPDAASQAERVSLYLTEQGFAL